MKNATKLRRWAWSMPAAALVLLSGAASAQITAQPLGGLDLFQAGARRSDVPSDIWRGASSGLALEVFEKLDDKPLSPAARETALVLLGASAAAPDGAAADLRLAAARVGALLALGDVVGADAVLDRTSGVPDSLALTETAAEAALHLGQDDDACRIGRELRDGRDAPYAVRLRAYCDAIGGRGPQAELALTLLDQQGTKDETFSRLAGALLANDPAAAGAPSLRTGLHAALSRRLGLDLAPALERASPAALQAIALDERAAADLRSAAAAKARTLGLVTAEQAANAGAAEQAAPPAAQGELGAVLADAAAGLAGTGALDPSLMERLTALAGSGDKTARARAQSALLLLAASGGDAPAEMRPALIRWEAGAADAAGARRLGLDLAADAGRKGEAALIALDIASAAGGAGPKPADRIEIVRALREAGLPQWRLWAREGFLQLAAPPAKTTPAKRK